MVNKFSLKEFVDYPVVLGLWTGSLLSHFMGIDNTASAILATVATLYFFKNKRDREKK